MSCSLHAYHAPRPQGTHRHHVIPLAWTRALGLPESRVVEAAPTCHDNVHRDLRDAIAGRPWHASGLSRELVLEPLAFYREHSDSGVILRALADELIHEG